MIPKLMTIPEQIFVAISDYYKGSFDSGTKVQEDASSLLDPFYEQCCIACQLFAQESFQAAGQTLISATAGIKRLLLAEHPRTLSNLFAKSQVSVTGTSQ